MRIYAGVGENNMHENSVSPVNTGEEYNVTIESVGEKGDGVCKQKGFVLFVPKTKKGDYVKIKVTKVFKKVGFAEVVEKLEKPAKPKEPEYQAPAYVPEPSPEDTEDFGDELDEDAGMESFSDYKNG